MINLNAGFQKQKTLIIKISKKQMATINFNLLTE